MPLSASVTFVVQVGWARLFNQETLEYLRSYLIIGDDDWETVTETIPLGSCSFSHSAKGRATAICSTAGPIESRETQGKTQNESHAIYTKMVAFGPRQLCCLMAPPGPLRLDTRLRDRAGLGSDSHHPSA